MKYILSFLFLSVVFHCIQANEDRKQILKTMNRAVLTLRNIEKAKEEKMRKLQSTDEDEIIVNTIPKDIPADSPTIKPAEELTAIPDVPPVKTEDKTVQHQKVMEVKNSIVSNKNQIKYNSAYSLVSLGKELQELLL